MIAVVSLLVVLGLSMIVVRVAAVALSLTGLSRQSASFQARSAFTGTGFTTAESEKVVQHPVRRKIITWLMLIRSGGIVTMIATLIMSFVGVREQGEGVARALFLFMGLLALWWVSSSQWVDKYLSRLIERALHRWTDLDTRDYAGLLRLQGDFRVVELQVAGHDWLSGRRLDELNLSHEGVLVLGIERAGGYIGAPRGDAVLKSDDRLLLYGTEASLVELDERPSGPEGNRKHVQAVGRHREVQQREQRDVERLAEADAAGRQVKAEADAAQRDEPPNETEG